MYTPCRSRRFGLVSIGSFIYLIFSSSGIIFHCLPTPSPPPSQACAPHFLAAARATVPGQDDEKAIFHPTLSLLFSKLSTSALPPTPTEQLVRWCWMVGGQTVGRSIFYCCLGGSSSTSRGGNNSPATVQYLLYHSSHPDNYLMGIINWGEEGRDTAIWNFSRVCHKNYYYRPQVTRKKGVIGHVAERCDDVHAAANQ